MSEQTREQWAAAYEARKLVPATDEELRSWLLDVESRGSISTWEPHVEQRMQRIFARLRASATPTSRLRETEMAAIVEVIELYVQYRSGRARA